MTDVYSIAFKADTREVNKAKKDLGGLGDQAGKSGRSVSNFGEQVDNTTRQVGGMERATKLATRAVTALGAALSVREVVQFANAALSSAQNIERQARAISVTTEEFQRLRFTFAQFGADSADIADVFGTLSDRAEDAKSGMQSFIDDFKLVGIEVDDLRGKNGEQLFRTFADAISQTESSTRRHTAAVRILGDDIGNRLLPLLMQGTDGIDRFGSQATLASEDVVRAASDMQTQLNAVVGQIQGELTVAMQEFLVENREAILGAAEAVSELASAFRENIDAIETVARIAGTLAAIKLASWAYAAAGGVGSLAGAFTGLKTATSFLRGPAGMAVLLLELSRGIDRAAESAKNAEGDIETISEKIGALYLEAEKFILAGGQSILDFIFPENMLSEPSRAASRVEQIKDILDKLDVLTSRQTSPMQPLSAEAERRINEANRALFSFGREIEETEEKVTRLDKVVVKPDIEPFSNDLREVLGLTVQIPGELEEIPKAVEKANNSADDMQDTFESVADSVESEFSDAFYNIFEDGFSAFDDLADGILDIFKRTLADMAAVAIRQQIVIPITQQIVGGAGDILSGGQSLLSGGGAGDLLGSLTQAGAGADIASSFARSGVGQSLGLSTAISPGPGAPGNLALTQTGSNISQAAGAATSLAGMGGNLVGTAIGGGSMESSMGATAGQLVGAAIGGPVGSFIGGAIGGAVGGALGDSEMDKAIAKQKESIEKRQDETIATIAQNTRLSESEKERRTAARRERELAGALSEGNRIRLEGLHALEEYADRLQEINRINDERNELERRYLNVIGDTASLRQLELDATESANRGILSFIFSLEDAAKKVQETESNAREAFRALQNTVRREQDAIEERLSGPIDALNSALDSLEGRTLTQRPRLARTQAQKSLRLAREEGIDTLSERNLERALDVVAEPSQQLFGSFTDYQRDFKQTETLVRELRDDAERQRDTQLGTLQAQLDQGREQLNALFGINDSVLTVSQAMNNLGASISAAESAQQSFASISAPENAPSFEERPTPPSSLRPGQTNDPLWESIVGRAYEEHIAAFGTDWFGSRTTNQERQAQLARMQNAYLDAKGFADGGMHEGGLRMVGERGPELEVTGPSRIYSNNDTRKMMGTDEMIDEIRSLREEVGELRREQGESQYQITRNTKRTRDTLEKFDIDGLPPERT